MMRLNKKNGIVCFIVLPYNTELFKMSHKHISIIIKNRIEKNQCLYYLALIYFFIKKVMAVKIDKKYNIDTTLSESHK